MAGCADTDVNTIWVGGVALSLKGVYATGYAVLGATVVSSAALAMI